MDPDHLVCVKHHYTQNTLKANYLNSSSTVLFLLSLLFLKESYAPVISERRQKLLQNSHQNGPINNGRKIDIEGYVESNSTPAPPVQRDPLGIIYRAITRPWRFLATSPIVVIVGFFLAVHRSLNSASK